jgi:trk system potassium uptake protein TrkA
MIAGGGNIGLRVAQALEAKCQVKLIEVNRRRAEFVAGDP